MAKPKARVHKTRVAVGLTNESIATGARTVPAEAQRDEDIAPLAYLFWLERGSPVGSPEHDWFRAEEELRKGAPLAAAGANGR